MLTFSGTQLALNVEIIIILITQANIVFSLSAVGGNTSSKTLCGTVDTMGGVYTLILGSYILYISIVPTGTKR